MTSDPKELLALSRRVRAQLAHVGIRAFLDYYEKKISLMDLEEIVSSTIKDLREQKKLRKEFQALADGARG